METILTNQLLVLVNPTWLKRSLGPKGPMTVFMAFYCDVPISQDRHEICHCQWASAPTNHRHRRLPRSIPNQFDPIFSNNNKNNKASFYLQPPYNCGQAEYI
jgi:hypothetical protein